MTVWVGGKRDVGEAVGLEEGRALEGLGVGEEVGRVGLMAGEEGRMLVSLGARGLGVVCSRRRHHNRGFE